MTHTLQQTWLHEVVQTCSFVELQQVLKERGADGWELVNVVHNTVRDPSRPMKVRRETHSEDWYAFFKQPV
jgi:hypothetical protein